MTGFFADGKWWETSADDHIHIGEAATRLSIAGVDNSLTEARVLFVKASGDQDLYSDLITRRAGRAPMSHLLGHRDFYKHRFLVTSDVLDPRPDTEILVEEALKPPFKTVLDLGTGSGCILLSLLAERESATGVGTDISDKALAIARANRETLKLQDRATLTVSNWYMAVTGCFDLIVSNPPYIALDEMAGLAPEVRDHEPRIALTDEGDGLSCYRAIVRDAPQHLNPGGHLMVEIGPTQGAAVSDLMAQHGFEDIRVIPDLDGRDRVIRGQFLPE